MKWYLHFWIISILITIQAPAQQIVPSVINVTSKSDSIGTVKIDWSVGEIPLISTATGTGIIITNGFLQSGSGFVTTAVPNLPLLSGAQVKVFPNPVATQLQLQFMMGAAGKVKAVLYDAGGKRLQEETYIYTGGTQMAWFEMHAYPSGSYQLYLFYQPANGYGARTAVYSIQKIR